MAFCFLVKIAVRGQAGIVQQQHAHGDARAPGRIGIGFRGRGAFREIARDGRIEVEAFLLDEDHRRGRGDDGFGQRSHVVDRVCFDRRAFASRVSLPNGCTRARRSHPTASTPPGKAPSATARSSSV